MFVEGRQCFITGQGARRCEHELLKLVKGQQPTVSKHRDMMTGTMLGDISHQITHVNSL